MFSKRFRWFREFLFKMFDPIPSAKSALIYLNYVRARYFKNLKKRPHAQGLATIIESPGLWPRKNHQKVKSPVLFFEFCIKSIKRAVLPEIIKRLFEILWAASSTIIRTDRCCIRIFICRSNISLLLFIRIQLVGLFK